MTADLTRREPSEADLATTAAIGHELDDVTPGAEELALHEEDALNEALDDERDLDPADLTNDREELEWRISARQAAEVDAS